MSEELKQEETQEEPQLDEFEVMMRNMKAELDTLKAKNAELQKQAEGQL
ncbi:hypothetical protein [Candidatus Lokiarchaeum ossiferum]